MICSHCKNEIPLDELKKFMHAERIRQTFKESKSLGIHIGRPYKVPREDVLRLRRSGWTMQKIASHLKISLGAVQGTIERAKNYE